MASILFDLDGVLYEGESPVPGAVDALDWVRAHGIPHLFLTNTTSRPRRALVDRLARMGFAVEEPEIVTPPVAAVRWLQREVTGAVALFVPEATRAEFAVLDVADEGADAPVGAVVVGDLGSGWDFQRLNRAFRLLMGRPAPALVALGMTRYWQAPDGLRLDTAPFVVALAHASGVDPVVCGKPAAPFFQAALTLLGADAGDTWMIGDDIRGDVQGAQAAGVRGALVRTGKFRAADLEGDVRPDAVLDSIAALPDWWGAVGRPA